MSSFSLYFVTSSRDKFEECKEILEMPLQQIRLELNEMQALEIEEVVKYKTLQAYDYCRKNSKRQGRIFVITEDTGLYIQGLKGLPGALTKWFLLKLGNQGICDIIKKYCPQERRAFAKTVVGFFDGQEYKEFQGRVKGKIAQRPLGENNFGWDPIFIPDGQQKTFAEMTKEEKNKISMRRKAFDKLHSFCERS